MLQIEYFCGYFRRGPVLHSPNVCLCVSIGSPFTSFRITLWKAFSHFLSNRLIVRLECWRKGIGLEEAEHGVGEQKSGPCITFTGGENPDGSGELFESVIVRKYLFTFFW